MEEQENLGLLHENTRDANPNTAFSFFIRAPSNLRFRRDSLDESQSDVTYSRPVIFLDLIWNLAFAFVSMVLLSMTVKERPSTPLRVWILGYAFQCLMHVGFVCVEFQRSNHRRENELSSWTRVTRKLESISAVGSFLWWIVGFYWIVVGGEALLQDAPRLYWLTVVFLAFDVFFAIFCTALACILGIAMCCCFPCILAILYAMKGQEGASDAEISILPRFRFCQFDNRQRDVNIEERYEVAPSALNQRNDVSTESLSLLPEDSACCICLCKYEHGAELHRLPCNHHFHSRCIAKWLRINATCPLCKFNILTSDDHV